MMAKKKSGSEEREKRVLIGFRATESEAHEIDHAADQAGLTRSAYVRAQSLAQPRMRATRSRPTVAAEILARLLAQLGKCGSNLNQIARRLNEGEHVHRDLIAATLDELRKLAAEIMQALRGNS